MVAAQKRLSKLQSPPDLHQAGAQRSIVHIQSAGRWPSLELKELWSYRELLYFLVWRDVKVRYKQSAIGAAWAILQPLLTMVVFMFMFVVIAPVETEGLPYSILTFTALLPWSLFAGALTRTVTSVVGQSHLISKVYFPRLLVPFSSSLSGVVDFAIAFVILVPMMAWFRIVPTWGLLFLPVAIVLALATALAVGLWLSAINVKYRDVGHAIPFMIQIWLFLSPVAYPVSRVPEQWRLFYSLNPMVGVIEAFQWALLGKEQPNFGMIAITTVMVVALFLSGIVYFKRMEETFADVV